MQIQSLVIPVEVSRVTWKFCRLLEEPDFGPGDRLHTAVFIVQTHAIKTSGGDVHWFTYPNVYKLLVQAEIGEKRIGLLAAIGFSLFTDNLLSKNCVDVPGQEYPPGITILPMESRTLKPFSKTNLVVIASARPVQKDEKNEKLLTFGDSLIVDPGSSSVAAKAHLARIIKSLPEKLLVFLTHHHVDHIEGLTIVQQQNPQAIILAHESTLKRAGKAVKAFDCMAVSGGARLLVAGQELEIIAAPGHTDSHLALFHLGVRTLIAGDHCVGEGSSFLDADSGGNMQEYLCTTRQFIELRPHFIVPMHGRPNFWPIHLLKGYIRHREARELKILKAIENGARTAYEIVSEAYKETPATAWPAALHNVKLHVEHLNQSNSLPLDFSIKAFQNSSGAAFFFNHVPTAVSEVIRSCMSYRHKAALSGISGSIVLVVAIGLSLLWAKCKHYHARA
ncbi:hypothetical protein O6H91_06G100300 [Diphasiastrum complanatum]|uniref:Uncharacterized protein n=1 Tax=Diphasiastrum complanatum TaxID=34168 RepID=A0ACC2DH55_DIPCM|nr:hypothetical protein O6H91_06G100300 [Diphasiastrum complanatum]